MTLEKEEYNDTIHLVGKESVEPTGTVEQDGYLGAGLIR